MISRDGVYYDLSKSHYRYTQNGITFVFSSQLHKDKFESRMKENRKRINISLTKRFGFSVDVSTLADVVLYRKIETRGFLIEIKGEHAKCPSSITLTGETVTVRR